MCLCVWFASAVCPVCYVTFSSKQGASYSCNISMWQLGLGLWMYRYLVAHTHGLQLVPWFQQGGEGGQSPSNYVKEESWRNSRAQIAFFSSGIWHSVIRNHLLFQSVNYAKFPGQRTLLKEFMLRSWWFKRFSFRFKRLLPLAYEANRGLGILQKKGVWAPTWQGQESSFLGGLLMELLSVTWKFLG